MLLTDQERKRFADYLEWDAANSERLLEQMIKINAPSTVIHKYRAEVAASRLIVAKLRSTESASIG